MKKIFQILCFLSMQSFYAQVIKVEDFERFIQRDSTEFIRFCKERNWEMEINTPATGKNEGKIVFASPKPIRELPNNRIVGPSKYTIEYVYSLNPAYTRIYFTSLDDLHSNILILREFINSGYVSKETKTEQLEGENKDVVSSYLNKDNTLVHIHRFREGVLNNEKVVFGRNIFIMFRTKDFKKNKPSKF